MSTIVHSGHWPQMIYAIAFFLIATGVVVAHKHDPYDSPAPPNREEHGPPNDHDH